MIVMKIFTAIIFLSHLISHSVIRIKSEKIFQLYYELKAYRSERLTNSNKNINFSIISLAFLILSIATTAMLTFEDQFEDLFESFYFPAYFKLSSIVGQFYLHGWNILIQFIYYELYTQYNNIIKSFYKELIEKKTIPSKNVILMTQRNISNFIRFQSNLKSNIGFITYFIILNLIAYNVCLLCTIISDPDLNSWSYSSIMFYAIFSNLYFIWIRLSVSNINRIEENMIKKLNKWQNFRRNREIEIELLVLKRETKKFNGNQDEFGETVV
jgi:hypothetical protein